MAVVIGRNEGERLTACLGSLQNEVSQIIYVDSGSTDGSVAAAKATGADVVELNRSTPFTAARARNAGLAEVDGADFVQFVDGDCVVAPGWIETAAAYLETHDDCVVVCGRRREQHPDVSVYNRLCDWEWNTPIGNALSCGGDAMMRVTAVQEVGGYRESLIAGEEPELCVRLRSNGGRIRRLDADMTFHDARISTIFQWWARSRRTGYAFAEGAALHGGPPERHWVKEHRRALAWGVFLPLALVFLALFWSVSLLGFVAYPLQILRLSKQMGWEVATFTVLGKFPEALGALEYHFNHLRHRQRGLIEYR